MNSEQILAKPRTGLWRQPSFLRLWTSETISSFGAQFTELAIPFTAILVLNVDSSQLGFLSAAITAPFLVFSLFAGVWVDRHKRRRVMIASNIGRVLLLALVPLAVLTGTLSIYLLLGVSFMVGVCRVFFDIAYQSFLPSIVDRAEIVEANSQLEASHAVSSVVGPGAAGIVIQIISAPFALAADIFSFITSTLILARIQDQEVAMSKTEKSSMISEAKEGLVIVASDARLRPLAIAGGFANFFEFAIMAIFILYAVDQLAIQPAQLGVVLSLGAVGAVVGALVAGRLSRLIGIGPAIIFSIGLGASVWGPLIYLATPATGTVLLIVAWFAGEVSFVSYSINGSSFRQAICPDRLQGRVNATLRFLAAGMVPLGSITGGFMGQFFGLRTAIGIASIGILVAPLFLALSPIRTLRVVTESDSLDE